jgi:2-oxoglutarate ferredoxin oxidoreductase subunit gamma
VVISDEEIGSPVVNQLDTVIVMNEPSLLRFEGWVKPQGTLIVNSSLIASKVSRNDVRVLYVPANAIADKLGSEKIANMVLLGSYIESSQVLTTEIVLDTMREKMAGKESFLPLNEAAIRAGMELVQGE